MCLCTVSVTVVLIELCRKESSLFMKESQLRLYYRIREPEPCMSSYAVM